MSDVRVITGRVRDDEGEGVLGLTVQAIDSDHTFDDYLGPTLTEDDGVFTIAFDPASLDRDEPYEGEPEIYLRVTDRDGQLLHVDESARSLPIEDAVIEIAGDDLEAHRVRPLAWERPSGPPIPMEWGNVIDRAIHESLAERGTEMHALLLDSAKCPQPPLLGRDGAVDDAVGALRGDPDATQRFRRTLDTVVADREISPPESYFSETWRQRVGSRMAERAAVFRHLAERDESLTAGPISTSVPVRECASNFETTAAADSGDIDALAEAVGAGGGGFDEQLSAVAEELREYPPAVDPQTGRTFFGAAIKAADSPERRRRYVAATFDALGSLAAYRDTYVAAQRVLEGEADGTELRMMIERGVTDCGPIDGPDDGDPFPDREGPRDIDIPERPDIPGWEDEDDLVDEHWWGFCQTLPPALFPEGDPYTITRLSPPKACPGEQLTIHGRDFGNSPGKVVFETDSGKRRVAPDSWSDTKITVMVPSDAVAGSITLSITRGTSELCDRYVIERAPPSSGSITTWNGGNPSVSVYSLDAIGTACFAPGESFDISWRYRPRSLSGVTVSMDRIGSRTVSSASGTWSVTIPNNISSPTDLTMRIEATNACGQSVDEQTITVNVRPTLSIEDVEVTQSIQSFTIGPGGPDNGLDTIEDKDTIVRVYVSADRNGFNNDEVPDVTGSLVVPGEGTFQPINGSSPTGSASSDPSITAVANPTRAETDHSLNFRLPTAVANGQQTFDIYVQGPEICGERATVTRQMQWSWSGGTPLPVRYVRIRDNRSGSPTTQPNRGVAAFTVRRAFDLLPSPPTDIGPAPDDTLATTTNFQNNNSPLLNELERHRSTTVVAEWNRRHDWYDLDLDLLAELRSHHYVGLTQPFNRGRAFNPGQSALSCTYQDTHGSGIDNSPANRDLRRVKTAHELGHNLDFDHINQGCNGGGPNCGGSCYNHPNGGRLTEIVFDPYWNRTVRDESDAPGTEWDFMSYGCTRWASSDSWSRLQNSI